MKMKAGSAAKVLAKLSYYITSGDGRFKPLSTVAKDTATILGLKTELGMILFTPEEEPNISIMIIPYITDYTKQNGDEVYIESMSVLDRRLLMIFIPTDKVIDEWSNEELIKNMKNIIVAITNNDNMVSEYGRVAAIKQEYEEYFLLYLFLDMTYAVEGELKESLLADMPNYISLDNILEMISIVSSNSTTDVAGNIDTLLFDTCGILRFINPEDYDRFAAGEFFSDIETEDDEDIEEEEELEDEDESCD